MRRKAKKRIIFISTIFTIACGFIAILSYFNIKPGNDSTELIIKIIASIKCFFSHEITVNTPQMEYPSEDTCSLVKQDTVTIDTTNISHPVTEFAKAGEPVKLDYIKQVIKETQITRDDSGFVVAIDLESQGFKDTNILKGIDKYHKLREVILSDNELMKIDLEPLAKCNTLETIDINNNQISEIDLTPLTKCNNLKVINISDNILRKVNLEPLKECSQVECIEMSNNLFTHINLEPIKWCKNLKYISLGGYNLSAKIDISPLQYCPDLEELKISYDIMSEINFKPLRECTNLKKLSIHGFVKKNHTEPIKYCKNLEELHIKNISFYDIDTSPFAQCPKLKYLSIENVDSESDINLVPLSQNTNLKVINIHCVEFSHTSETCDFIRKNPQIKVITNFTCN